MKDMAIIGVTGEGFCTNHQAIFVRAYNAGLVTAFVWFALLALADAFDFRGMQCV